MVISLFLCSTKLWTLWRKHRIFVTWGLIWSIYYLVGILYMLEDVLVRVLQREREIYYRNWLISMEVEKSHNLSEMGNQKSLLFSVWAPRPENQELWSWRAGKDRCPSSRKETCLFCLLSPFRPSGDSLISIHFWWWRVLFLSLLNQMLISSRNNITDTPQNTFYQVCRLSLVQSNWHVRLTVTEGPETYPLKSIVIQFWQSQLVGLMVFLAREDWGGNRVSGGQALTPLG